MFNDHTFVLQFCHLLIKIHIVQNSKTKTFQVFGSFEQWQDLVKTIDACSWTKDMLKIIGCLNQLKKYIILYIYIYREREREREREFNCKFNLK